MAKLRIVAMDGGGVLSIVSLALLARMADLEPTLLDRVDVWAGNSAGAINALRMAMPGMTGARRRLAIDECIAFWCDDFNRLVRRNLVEEAAALAGCLPFYTTKRLRNYLAKNFYQGARLRDLSPVAITSLKLDSATPDTLDDSDAGSPRPPGSPSVAPQVIHNFLPVFERANQHIEQFSPETRAADLAVASSSAPIMAPIFVNHVDGSLFANNPSMCTLAAVLNAYRIRREDVIILSMGAGANPRAVPTTERYQEWGYRPWLLDPHRPLLLLQVLIDAITATVDYQCRNILSDDNYVRINPDLPQAVDTTDRQQRAIEMAFAAVASVSDAQLRGYLARLRAAGWFADGIAPLRTGGHGDDSHPPTHANHPVPQ
jgi:hypothetical protein